MLHTISSVIRSKQRRFGKVHRSNSNILSLSYDVLRRGRMVSDWYQQAYLKN